MENLHMRISYNTTDIEADSLINRKDLAHAMETELQTTLKYLGAPTFAYEIGEYSIDKDGMVVGPDNAGLIDNLHELHSIKAVGVVYDKLLLETPNNDILTIEVPLDGFTPEKLDNLFKLVNAKAPLLKAAFGTDELPIKQTPDTLLFPWFNNADELHTRAYSTFVSLLCKTSIEKKRVNSKEKETNDNPKHAMRCFLLSLGMIGTEYKVCRKILLSKLDGNSSWNKNESYTAMQEQRRNLENKSK